MSQQTPPGRGTPFVQWLTKYIGLGLAKAVEFVIIAGIVTVLGLAGISISQNGIQRQDDGGSFLPGLGTGRTKPPATATRRPTAQVPTRTPARAFLPPTVEKNSGSNQQLVRCPYQPGAWEMFVGATSYDLVYDSGHWFYVMDKQRISIGVGNTTEEIEDVDNLRPGIWTNVHPFTNVGRGALWLCAEANHVYAAVI